MAIAYTSYKKFDSDWLPELPSHWGRQRIKFLTTFIVSGGTPSTGTDHYWGGDIPWVSPKDMKTTAISETEDYITAEALKGSAARLVPAHTLLMVVRSGILRHSIPVALSAREVAINQDIKAVGFLSSTGPAYARYFIEGLQAELLARWSKVGTTVESIESEYFANDEIPVPPLSEQIAIVSFLDREILRIDALIKGKRRLLELLEEQRLAVITHAVTKGLDPKVPMKDSGIEWLGQVPAHWEVKRQKFISPKVTVGIVVTPSAYYADEGVPALRGFNVKERHLDLADLVLISEDANELHSKSKIYAGDLVSVRTGQPGTTAVVPDELDGANCVDLIIIRQSDAIIPEFAAYFANSDAAKVQYGAGSEGALQQHFNIDTAKNLIIPVPPLDEQRLILQYLQTEESKLIRAIATLDRSVLTLTEYRSALITNAVTGKIDVRGEVAKEAAA